MNKKNNGMRNGLYYALVVLAMIVVVYFILGDSNQQSPDIDYSTFQQQLEDGKAKDMTIQPTNGIYRIGDRHKEKQEVKDVGGLSLWGSVQVPSKGFITTVLPSDTTLAGIRDAAQNNKVKLVVKERSTSSAWLSPLFSFLPLVIISFFFCMVMSQQGGSGGGDDRVMNFGKPKAKEADKRANHVHFLDIAGTEEEGQELVEVVEFLKDPHRFAELGVQIPADVLLEGPLGTGKTLLTKAIAGEAGVPSYPISGSDSVEMFVGTGANHVRDLFKTAKRNVPAVIFIDEIDVVGYQHGAGMDGGHGEREQALNQLLVRMDDFDGNERVIVIAATNCLDMLDPMLLHPGHFDCQILVERPGVKSREAILRVHAKNKPLADDVDLKIVAQQIPGFAGTGLKNVLNETALVAARCNKKKIDVSDADEAEDHTVTGPAKRGHVISKKEREMMAYHETRYTIVGLVLSRARVVHKIIIIPRGRAGGYMITLSKEDQLLMTKKGMLEQIVGLLDGCTVEEAIFSVQSIGASNDFERTTGITRSMVTEYRMSDKLRSTQYEGNHQIFVGCDYGQTKTYSEQIAFEIDQEVCHISIDTHTEAHEIIETYRKQYKLIAEKLLEYETLDAKAVKSLFETGKIPEGAGSDYPSEEGAQTFEETKRALGEKEAQKQVEEKQDFEETKEELHDEAEEVKVENGQTKKEVQSEGEEDLDSNPEYSRNNYEDRYK